MTISRYVERSYLKLPLSLVPIFDKIKYSHSITIKVMMTIHIKLISSINLALNALPEMDMNLF
jgi:hypothetical protein